MILHKIPEEMNVFILLHIIITAAICSSARPHGATWLPPGGFP